MNLLALLAALGAASAAFDPCSTPEDVPVTTPAPVSMADLHQAIAAQPVEFRDQPRLRREVGELFQTGKPTSKLHQFYGLLHVLGRHSVALQKPQNHIDLEMAAVRRLFSAAKVVPNPDFAAKVKSVRVESDRLEDYQYNFKISFGDESVKLPLNQGRGFGIFRDGKCQHAQALIFRNTIAFRTRELVNENLLVHKFENVDLFGDFGARTALVNVDLNFVSLNEIEFIARTNRGRVKAYVSEEEFKKNKHPWLLSLIMRVIPDNSVQVIDW